MFESIDRLAGLTGQKELCEAVKKLYKACFDASMTEHDIMLSRKIYRIYDCGNYRYIWNRK